MHARHEIVTHLLISTDELSHRSRHGDLLLMPVESLCSLINLALRASSYSLVQRTIST